MRHECDCGAIYYSTAGVHACIASNHGNPMPSRREEQLEAALLSLVEATEDTLRTHAETSCCAVTRKRCAEARALIAKAPLPEGIK